MEINLRQIKVGDLVNGYIDTDEEGVYAYGGRLSVRPKYQREFRYNEQQRAEVISTLSRGFPLNIMYWVENAPEEFELLDGQQRTISICQYAHNEFSYKNNIFSNLTKEEQNTLLDYELMIYVCKGGEKEKLEWFRVINTAGAKLTDQELRNASYSGDWLTDAKKDFSKTNCRGYRKANADNILLKKNTISQELLETVLKWITSTSNWDGYDDRIVGYMSIHQNDLDANELWLYYESVIDWFKRLFPVYRKEMINLDFGHLYNTYKDNKYNSNDLEQLIKRLMLDSDVHSKKGIYEYVLSDNVKHLNLRTFDDNTKALVFEKQIVSNTGKAKCPYCSPDKLYTRDQMQADHIIPWSKGGSTNIENCQLLCSEHNRLKSDKD